MRMSPYWSGVSVRRSLVVSGWRLLQDLTLFLFRAPSRNKQLGNRYTIVAGRWFSPSYHRARFVVVCQSVVARQFVDQSFTNRRQRVESSAIGFDNSSIESRRFADW